MIKLLSVIFCITVFCYQSNAQLLKKLKDKANEKIENAKAKAEQKVKDRVNNKEAQADNKVDGTMDNGLDKVEGVFKKKDKTETENKETKTEETENADTKTVVEKQETDEQNNVPIEPIKKQKITDPESILYTTDYIETADRNKPDLQNVIQFVQGKEFIIKGSFNYLQKIAVDVNNSKAVLKVVVYTSDTSAAAKKLSVKRAKTFVDYMVQFYKIPATKIYSINIPNNGNADYNKGKKENDMLEIIMIKEFK